MAEKAPTAADFDEAFRVDVRSAGLRAVWRTAEPDLPADIEPFSFLTPGLLDELVRALALAPGQRLVDLACGRGGPGLWLAGTTGAELVGVDFSPVAVAEATRRAGLFGAAARFVVGDLTRTGLPAAAADGVVCVDAMHFAADLPAAAAEALRLLRPGGRLALTNWQPHERPDPRLPARLRDRDWAAVLRAAGFLDVTVEARPEWHAAYVRVYRTALELGDPGEDAGLAGLQDEARARLPTVDLVDRVLVTARRGADVEDRPAAPTRG